MNNDGVACAREQNFVNLNLIEKRERGKPGVNPTWMAKAVTLLVGLGVPPERKGSEHSRDRLWEAIRKKNPLERLVCVAEGSSQMTMTRGWKDASLGKRRGGNWCGRGIRDNEHGDGSCEKAEL